MSESQNAVASAFDALIASLRDHAFSPTSGGASEFARVGGYMERLSPLVEAWKADLPASGKAVGKRGRKPKNAGGGDDASETVAAMNEDGSPTETQVDMPAPTGRSRGGRGA